MIQVLFRELAVISLVSLSSPLLSPFCLTPFSKWFSSCSSKMATIVLHLKFTEKNNNNKIFFFFFLVKSSEEFQGKFWLTDPGFCTQPWRLMRTLVSFCINIMAGWLGNYASPCCLVAKSYLTLGNPMNCNMPGFPVLHYLLEFTQTHVP